MQLGSLELQIFVALVLVLGSAFVALVCDFLKGNNEQLRERNIELRVRQDERERMGTSSPIGNPLAWLQGLAAYVRNPGLAEAMAGGAPQGATATAAETEANGSSTARSATTVAPPVGTSPEELGLDELTAAAGAAPAGETDADRNPQRRHRYDEFKAAARHQTWATKEELEQLAGRAARIRARHEASQRKAEEIVVSAIEAAEPESIPALSPAVAEQPRRPRLTELPRLESAPAALTAIPLPQAFEAAVPVPAFEAVPLAGEMLIGRVEEQHEPAAAVSFVEEAAPVEVLPEEVAFEVPPVVESPATADWSFRPIEEPAPVEQRMAAEAELPVEIEAVLSEPGIAATPAVPDAVAVEESVEAVVVAEAPAEPVVAAALIAIDPPALVAAIAEPEPIRTRIMSVAVTPMSEAQTEEFDFAIPAAAAPPPVVAAEPPAAPATPFVPAAATTPSFDVAALQLATTGEIRLPGAMSRNTPAEIPGDGKLDIPAGFHDSSILSQLIESQAPYSGVVVAIGLNDYETLREKLSSGNDSAAALNKMVLSMLRPQDFACRFQDDEFILIYPGERGSSAQRRLFQVSEKLWDFQLRSLGNLSVMFSWGGLEVTNETLSEAVASARERMYQTKRNRKPSPNLEFTMGRKKVVNG